MNKLDKKMNILIILLMLLNPIFDLITSFGVRFSTHLSFIGVLIRGIILFIMLLYGIWKQKIYKDKHIIISFSFIFLFVLLTVMMNLYLSNYNITFAIKELIQLFKILYFPMMLLILLNIIKKGNFILKKKYILISLLTYCILLFIPWLSGTGFESYSSEKAGTNGWFYAANEIGNIIAITLPFVFDYLFNKNKIFNKIILIVLLLISSIILGTKTPILSLIIVAFVYYINIFITALRHKKNINYLIFITSIFIFIVIVIPFTPFYKNMETHYAFQKVNGVKELFKNPNKIDHFFFGERFKFLNDTNTIYKQSNLPTKILGIGYYNKNTLEEYKTVEMDPVDTYFRFGPLMFIFIYFYIPLIYIGEIRKENKNKKTVLLPYLLCFVLSILICASAGHVFSAPSVCLYVVIPLVLLYNNYRVEGDNL